MLPMPPPPPAALGVFNEVFPLGMTPNEFYLPFLKAPLLAYQESETQEQRIAWLFRAIADLNKIIACHEEACKDVKKRLDKTEQELITLHEEIRTERIERIAADENLQDQIDTERAERIAADNQLQANIDAEAQARQQADAALGQRIDTERQERIATDNKLSNRITTEQTARQQADTALGQRIDDEAQARQQADTALDGRVTTLEECCEDVQGELSSFATKTALQAETTARQQADTALDGRVTTLEQKCENGECGGGTHTETIEEYINRKTSQILVVDYNQASEVVDNKYILDLPYLQYDVQDSPFTQQEIMDYLENENMTMFCTFQFSCEMLNVSARDLERQIGLFLETEDGDILLYSVSPEIKAQQVTKASMIANFTTPIIYTPDNKIGTESNNFYVTSSTPESIKPIYNISNRLIATAQLARRI